MLRIGTGGWAYFRVPGRSSLDAYSSAFDFVEVNSTYYEYPSPRSVTGWRRSVPEDFEFSLRCHRSVEQALASGEYNKIAAIAEKMVPVCNALHANVLAVLVQTGRAEAGRLNKGLGQFLSAFGIDETRVALEFRGQQPEQDVLDAMKESNAVHCVDLSRDQPAYQSDILYSRLFGKGSDNIYQFDDGELRGLAKKASAPKFEKSILAFHGVRMYSDAARMRAFLKTGEFPSVTGQVGLDSLRTVLGEDSRFPISKTDLVSFQGWKLFDASPNRRARAARLLEKLPEGKYQSLDSVISTLKTHPQRELSSSKGSQ